MGVGSGKISLTFGNKPTRNNRFQVPKIKKSENKNWTKNLQKSKPKQSDSGLGNYVLDVMTLN